MRERGVFKRLVDNWRARRAYPIDQEAAANDNTLKALTSDLGEGPVSSISAALGAQAEVKRNKLIADRAARRSGLTSLQIGALQTAIDEAIANPNVQFPEEVNIGQVRATLREKQQELESAEQQALASVDESKSLRRHRLLWRIGAPVTAVALALGATQIPYGVEAVGGIYREWKHNNEDEHFFRLFDSTQLSKKGWYAERALRDQSHYEVVDGLDPLVLEESQPIRIPGDEYQPINTGISLDTYTYEGGAHTTSVVVDIPGINKKYLLPPSPTDILIFYGPDDYKIIYQVERKRVDNRNVFELKEVQEV